MQPSKKIKPKKCKVCKLPYIPRSTFQKICSPDCAIEQNRINRMKEWDDETKRRKKAIKSKADYEEDAQKAVNAYIRIRDAVFPCISCGNYHNGQYHAGHYRSVGSAPELRFNTYNIHKQCAPCNNHLSGNPIPYRKRLKAKIGKARLDWLEGPHEPLKYTIDQLVKLRRIFKLKTKRLKNKQSFIL
jgi:hypothetical protein